MNINSLTSSFKSFFEQQNTTTADYDLSTNLTKRVRSIFKGVKGNHEKLPVNVESLPAVFVQADTTSFEPNQIGKTSRRDAKINFSIVGVTHQGMGVGDQGQGRETADMEALQLANNIEQIIHDNLKMSNTVQWLIVDNSSYDANISDNSYNSIVEINLKGQVRQ